MEKILIVKDIAIVSYLLCIKGVHLVKTERDRGIVLFYIAPKKEVEEFIAAYWSETAPVIQPKKLFSMQRDLKNLIFSGGGV